MRKLLAAGAVAAGALVLSLQAGAATKVYTITDGAFADSEASCTRITTNLGGWDCSYGNLLTTSRPKWLGPTFGGGHYAPGGIQTDPAYRVAPGTGTGGTTTGTSTGSGTSRVFVPAIDDGKFEAPITGTFTIDDNDTPVNAADDKLSSTFSIGALVRNIRAGQTSTVVQTWTRYDHEMAPITVSSATANADGGFDYVLGSRGFPNPICASYNAAFCFATENTMADFQTPAGFWADIPPDQTAIERTGVLGDPDFPVFPDEPPQPPPAVPTGNVGATTTGELIDGTCAGAYDDPNITIPDLCTTSQLVWGETEPLGFDNIVIKVSTNSLGAITSAFAYWSEEYFISFQSAPAGYDNSVDTGTFSFTAPVPVTGPNANNFAVSVLQGSLNNTLNTAVNCINFPGAVTVTLVTPQPTTLGTATVDGSQNVIYSSTGAAGVDPIVYQCDDGGFTREGTVTVTVAADTVPVAPDGTLTISTQGAAPGPNTLGTVNVAGLGGYDPGNAPSVVTIIAPLAALGEATVSGTTITYTPNPTFFSGADVVNYQITDGNGDTDTGVITVTIPNVVPILADGSITTDQDRASAPQALVITPGNGSVAQSPVTVTTAATSGTCAVTGTAAVPTLTYTPNAGSFDADSCVLTITDGDGSTDTGTFNITVNEIDDAFRLPGGGSAIDLWSLSLLGGLTLLRRRRRV